MQPLITCICPTTETRAMWLPRAIDCFLAQTYENKEFLIVTEAGRADTFMEPRCGTRVRAVVCDANLTVGKKRNIACEKAVGEIIAHFDDDDWSAKNRLAFQVERLQSTGLAMTGLSRMRFTDGQKWWRYHDPKWPLGTSLCYRRDWWEKNPFPDVQVASDSMLIYEARKQKQVDVVDCGDMMFASIHGGNLNKRSYTQPSFEPAEAMCFA